MKTNKKALMGMLVAMIMSLSVVGQFVNDRKTTNVQQLSYGFGKAASSYKGLERGVCVAYSGAFAGVAADAITAGVGCGIVTPASLVCYGAGALAGL